MLCKDRDARLYTIPILYTEILHAFRGFKHIARPKKFVKLSICTYAATHYPT